MNAAASASTSAGPPAGETEAVRRIARRLLWWQPPEVSLQQPKRLLAQVMTLGAWEDVCTARRIFGEEAFKEALREAPPGVFDARSWTYWHSVFRWLPVPPLPQRKL
jgi:hypothetical protein